MICCWLIIFLEGHIGKLGYDVFSMMESAALEVWNIKGYLLNILVMRRYSLLLNVKKSVAKSFQGALGISLGGMG